MISEGRAHGCNLRAGQGLEPGGARRVIEMGMGTQNPTDPVRTGREDGVHVGYIIRAGINDNQLPGPNQVSIGSGARHHAGVGCDDSGYLAIEALWDPGLQFGGSSHNDRFSQTGSCPPAL
jgi:hypothetical protein